MAAERRPRGRLSFVRSLRLRAVAVAVVVALAPLLFVAVSSTYDAGIGDRMRKDVQGASRRAAVVLGRELTKNPNADPGVLVDAVARRYDVRLSWFDPAGALLAQSDQDASSLSALGEFFFGPDGAPTLAEFDASLAPVTERAEFLDALAEGVAHGCRTSPQGRLMTCHAASSVAGHDGTYGVVIAQQSTRRAIRALYDLRYQLLKLTVFVVPFAIVLALWLGRRMVLPVERLRAQALAQIESVSPGVDLDMPRRDEFGDLADAFNLLLGQLRSRARDQEAFVADLAHEFKNPVAAIRAASESMGQGLGDEARAQRIARVLADSSARLDVLVSQFLELARAEAGMTGQERTEFDLDVLCRRLVDGYGSDERFSRVTWNFAGEAGERVRVNGVASGLETAVRNLLENAASFAGDDGRVSVSVRLESPTRAVVSVHDDGPGIATEDLPHVFDRFFTKRKSGRGTGLGLAMVKAIANAHDGSVTVVSGSDGGSRFQLRLPALRA